MMFFQIEDEPNGIHRGAPYAAAFVPWRDLDWFLPNGERARFYGGGPGKAEIEGGRKWPDAMGTDGSAPPFLVTERVVVAMRDAEVTGFEAYPITITHVTSKGLQKKRPWPQYFYLGVHGHIDIDIDAGGPARPNGSIPRLVPILETWDGSDLFVMRNRFNKRVFCTRKILELAHEHRWSNFMFQPMDVLDRHGGRIDYLAQEWPPERWYPLPPSTGKTMRQWLDELLADEYASMVKLALLDFGEEALSSLLALFDDPTLTPRQRYNVAEVLQRFKWEFASEFPPGIDENIPQALSIGPPIPPPPPGVDPD